MFLHLPELVLEELVGYFRQWLHMHQLLNGHLLIVVSVVLLVAGVHLHVIIRLLIVVILIIPALHDLLENIIRLPRSCLILHLVL